MPVICDHPDWWALEVLHGAPMQFIDPAVLKIYWDHKSTQGKEEGDTSQVCRLYDQDPPRTTWFFCTAASTCCARRRLCASASSTSESW